MIKKAGILVLVICLFLCILSPVLVHAGSGLSILDSSAETGFPLTLKFSLSAESDVDITDIRLHYTVECESFARVTSEVYIQFVSATRVDAQWTWDMRRIGGLPPGTTVEYWWTVEDASDARVETAPEKIQFDDDRYAWQTMTEGQVTIYWYEGGQSFISELMTVAQQALSRLYEDTGAYLKKPVKMYIYANTRDLQGAMIFPTEWTGGVAFSRFGTIAIGIEPTNLTWGKRAIAHELTHLVVHQMTLNPYIDLPTWLDEGLAMHTEGPLSSGFVAYLNIAIDEDSLITVRSLSSPFSAHAEESYLSYAQSYSIVEFLITSYGQDKMLELLTAFSEGNSYDGALEKVYGFNMDGLDALWCDYAARLYKNAVLQTTAVPPVKIDILCSARYP